MTVSNAFTANISNPQQWDDQTTRDVKLARASGVDPAPLFDLDAMRRENMHLLLQDVEDVSYDRHPGTDELNDAKVTVAHQHDNDAVNWVGGGFGALVLGGFGCVAAAGLGPKTLKFGVAGAIVGASLLAAGFTWLNLSTKYTMNENALKDAVTQQPKLDAEADADFASAVNNANKFAAEVKAHPTAPVE